MWKLATTPDCSFCFQSESLFHVVAGCKLYLEQGCSTCRHNTVLKFLAQTLLSLQPSKLYIDLPGYLSLSIVPGESLCPGMFLSIEDKCLYTIEVTVGFETSLERNAEQKEVKYRPLLKQFENKYHKTKFINVLTSSLGMFVQASASVFDMCRELGIKQSCLNYIPTKRIPLNRFTRWCNWAGMKIRVSKCVTFGIKKSATSSVQFLPKLTLNNSLVPNVESNKSFMYLGRYFNFNMDSNDHMSTLLSTIKDLMIKMDNPPCHPKYKLLLYHQFVLSKLYWHLTIADLSKTWVIKSSPHLDIKTLWAETSYGANLQYVQCQNTKEVLTSIQHDHGEGINTTPLSQGLVILHIIKNSRQNLKGVWSSVQQNLPRNIFKFSVKYRNNTLPTCKNLCRWGLSQLSNCSF